MPMTVHSAVRHWHLVFVTLSIGGFAVRGLWRIAGRALPQSGWRHKLPHINDTLLLAAGIGLTVITGQYPLADAWLTAKLLGLLAYIALGWVALRESTGPGARVLAWLGALLAFGYVASVAVTRSPWGCVLWIGLINPAGGSAAF